VFGILPPGPKTLTLNNPMLPITDEVTIDGTTQPGGRPVISGAGGGLGPNDGILELGAGSAGSIVRGLALNGSEAYGLVVESTGNTIQDTYVGTNAAGTASVGNLNGILVSGNDNTIGGLTVAARNVISGNAEAGLQITGASNIVRGNYIGLTADGSAALANILLGVEVLNGDGNRIGVDDLSGNGRNVISGALELISVIDSDFTRVTGNWLGTDASGTDTSLALAPGEAGISVRGGVSNQIGVTDAGNVIAGADGIGESGVGIRVTSSSANSIVANSIGTDPTGVFDLGHYGAGILLSDTDATLVSRNLIGFTRPLDPPLTGSGIVVESGLRNRLTENLFRSNNGLAIDLGGDGPTPNDGGAADDADTGANDLLNRPLIAQATLVGTTLTVSGTIDSNPNDTFTVEVFVREGTDDDQDARRFLGAQTLPTPASGETPFSVDFILGPGDVDLGDVVVATAIDGNNDTSELSAGVVVAEPSVGATAEVTIAPQAGSATVTAPARVELEDVPAETFIAAAKSALEPAPLGAIPLGAIPLGAIPLGAIPLGAIGFLDPQIRALLDGIALSTVPLAPPQSWSALLQGTSLAGLPLQSLSLKQALDALAAQPAGIGAVPLGAIGLRGSVLGSLTPEAVGLGVAPLGAIDIGDEGADEAGDTNLEDWCEWLSGPPVNCTNPASLQTESVLSTSLRGVPLGAIPLGAIPLGAIPLGAIPLGAIPLGAIDIEFSPLGAIPLGAIPLGAIPLGAIPLGAIPLGAIDLQRSPLGAIPLGAIPLGAISTIFTCSPSCPTGGVLRDHVAQLRPNLTLEQLMRAVGPPALGNVTFAGVLLHVEPGTLDGLTVKQFVETVLLVPGNQFTFADLLAAFLAESSLGWERLNLTTANVNQIAAAAGTARYAVEVELTPDTPAGMGASNTTLVSATLPAGFAYISGSAALDDLSTPAAPSPIGDPGVSGTQLNWMLPLTVGPRFRLTFDARPRSTLGPAQATVEADPAGGPVATGPAPATITVSDTFEANGDPAGALTTLDTSSFYLSYVTGADDVDFFSFPVPSVPGTRVTFNLSHLDFDGDLVVYGPNGQLLRDEKPGTEPLDGQPLDDDGPTLTSEADALEQQTLSDLALANLPVLGVATLRGTEDDAVTVVSDGRPGTYVVQVTGFNGATSAEPYMLRAEQRAPVAVPSCTARPFANAGTNSTSLTRGTVPAAVDTVFVVNKAQWERVHGAAAVASALTSLDGQMAGMAADGHPSAILQVDADPDVQAAVASWNACPTELSRANAVMREIGLAIDAFRAAHVDAGSNSTVRNIVLLGDDEVIPSARLEDRTTVANEDGYAETFNATSELATTLRQAYFLSDDPYGDVDPIPFFDRQLHIPDVPVGRLPTTPAAAVRAVTRFTQFNGRLAPTTAATSGYEFLTDGAQQVDAALRSIPGVTGSNPPGLIGDNWNKAALLTGFLPGGVPRGLSSINGHADHRGLEPAAGSDLFGIGDLPPVGTGATQPYDGALVFSMGCHAGLAVSDVFAVSPLGTSDWPQAYTQRGAIYAASSGYAYGDGKLVAYSEDLHRRFAEHLGGFAAAGDLTVGEAIVLAKQDYFGELGLVGVYDEKASSEFTLYGLPMWRIGGPSGTAAMSAPASAPATATVSDASSSSLVIQSAPSDQELVVEPATGLTAEQLTTDWTPPPATPANGGSYVVGQDGVQVTHFRPVEPKTVLPVTVPLAHGALITELSSRSTTPFDPYFARPIVDSTAHEPLLDWDRLVHPAKLQTVTTSKLGTTKRHRLVLATGQFTGQPGGGETGTQRLFPHIQALVFSAPSNDYAKPILGRIVATGVGPSVAFSVETRDQAPNGANDVVRVRVGYLDQPDGGTTRAWRFLDLVRTPSTDRWTGAGPLVSATAQFLYFVQAVDRAGNVAVSTNKGIYYEEEATAPSSDDGLSIDAPAPPASGWYGGNVPVTVRLGGQPAIAADNILVDLGGGAGFQAYTGPVTVTGDGSHTVTARAPDGREVSLTVLIDTGPPQIVIGSPAQGAQIVQGQPLTADYQCLDAGAGVDPSGCVGTVANGAAINTSTVGAKTFTVNAQDRLGKTATRTVTYTVVRRSILFASSRTGFGDLYSVGEGGGTVTRLTTGNAIDAEPARSPDGTRIAFTSTRNGNIELYSMNADGTDVRRLTTSSAIDTSPAWSPDGTKIVFSSNRTGNQFDIWVMNADGTSPQRLTTHGRDELTPAWSPNGQKIAFTSLRTGDGDVYVMNANGSSQTRLTTSNDTDAEPDWSPDGAKIAFSTNRHGDSNFELYSMNANGSSQTRLTNVSGHDTSPNFSADGTKLVFSSTRNGNLELYVVNANGSSPTRVTNHPAIDATPDW
jgi:Tol biopolymer transport system component